MTNVTWTATNNNNWNTTASWSGLTGGETFPGQTIYHLRCTHCGHDYGANGTDIHLRRCPSHQNGAKGEPLRDPAPNLFGPEIV